MLPPIFTVKARANNDHEVVETYAFLDLGSTASFCTESLLAKLKVTGCDVLLMTTTISGQNQPRKAKFIQNLMVLDLDEYECTVLT